MAADTNNKVVREIGEDGVSHPGAGGSFPERAAARVPRLWLVSSIRYLCRSRWDHLCSRLIEPSCMPHQSCRNNHDSSGPAKRVSVVISEAATEALLAAPAGVALDGEGNLFVADFGNNHIVVVS